MPVHVEYMSSCSFVTNTGKQMKTPYDCRDACRSLANKIIIASVGAPQKDTSLSVEGIGTLEGEGVCLLLE